MDNYQSAKRLMENINQVFVGKEAVVENLLTAFLAGGHVLLEDVPGVGKTTLALALAKSMACRFGRIQFTPGKNIKGADGAPADAETAQKMGVHLLPNLRLNPHSLLQSPITSYIIKITIHGLITAL